MQELFLNRYKKWPKHEIFSKTYLPPETPFFIRLDGWKFRKLSEIIKAEKPFDKKFAKCLVSSGRILFKKGFSPALVYVASDELNILFLNAAPFRRRVEKIDSMPASLVSSAFTLYLQKYLVARWKINENWKLPLFTSKDGVKLIKQILEWTRQKRKK